MRLVRHLRIIIVLTILMLVYIHMQMQIFDLAYQGKSKQQHIRELIEKKGSLMYAIVTLKSANHLGVQLLAEDSGMEFVDPNNILPLSTPKELITEDFSSEEAQGNKKMNPLLSLLSIATRAEAKGR